MGSEDVTFRDGDVVSKVKAGTKKLIIHKSIKNVPQGDGDTWESSFPGRETIEEIDIKRGVESIGMCSFSFCRNLRAVAFPSTIKEIGEWAFWYCSNLEEVDLSKTKIEHIDKKAFYKCEHLKTIIFPSTLKEIGEGAFYKCKNLEEVDLSKTEIKKINKQTFSSCENLKTIIFPSIIKKIGEGAFAECTNLTEVDLSKTKITHINSSSFTLCRNLKFVIFPSTLEEIGEMAFFLCENLTTSFIPESIKRIGYKAFSDCNLLPAFMYKNIIEKSTEAPEISDTITISENVEKEQYLNNDTIRVVEVEEGVERIGEAAFDGCTSLESVKLPKSLQEIDDYVFGGCTSLESIQLPQLLQEIGIGAFENCSLLQEINIPENVTVIQWRLFSGCTSLKHVTLSPSTTEIEHRAFEDCTSLKNIELPQTLEVIGDEAFQNCKSLKKIQIPKGVKELGGEDGSVFAECTSLEEVTFENGSDIETIKFSTFYQCTSLKEIELPSAVTEIKHYAFSECSSLKYINIHDNITTIGWGAFCGCTSLESIRIPSKQTQICESTFKNCTSLTSITIPRSVNKIGKEAFRGCTLLREVTIQNPNIEIGEGAFAGCDALENIRGLPSSEKNIKSYIDRKVFEGCLSLENPIGNKIHIAAEGKYCEGEEFPQHGHLWIKQALKEKNEQRKKELREATSTSKKNLKDDATFIKDYNGNTAFECAVRGGAPLSYLNVLAKGFDENGKTHFDIFADEYARKQPEDFTADELAFLIELNSKLIAATPIGEGRHYIDSLEELLQSPLFDPLKVPEFIHILNNIFKSKVFAFLLMLEFIFPALRILSFLMISDVYFDDDEGRVGKEHFLWFILMYVSIGYLIIREFFQIKHGFLAYITDILNWYDIFIIFISTFATIKMHTTDYVEEEKNYWMKSFVIFTTFNIWMFAILKTKVLSVNFAKFVSGIINIIWTLVPFILVSFLMLGAFAHMYFINDRTSGTYPDFPKSLLQTYSSLLAFDGLPFYNTVGVFFKHDNTTVVLDENDSMDKNEMRITMFFGFFVVVLLSNVLIAVLSAAWEDVSERGRDDFLLFRVRLLLETQEVFNFFDMHEKMINSIKSSLDSDKSEIGFCSLSPDANYKKMWGKSKKFSEVLIRMNPVLFGRIILNLIYIVLGIIFGLTWPTAVREALFCIDNSEAIADKRNRLQTRLNETKREVGRLRKIDKHITKKPDDIYLRLSECDGIPSHFQLKKKILSLEKQVKKQTKDVDNFKTWEKGLKKEHNKEKKD